MTKLRPPLTFADAVTRVAGVLGWAEVARLVARSDRAVRYWSEPDCDTAPTVAQALALDAAYRAAGGEGAPFFQAYEFQLDIQVARQEADRRALTAEIADTARECGEAIAAGLTVAGGASPLETHRAVAEAEQAHSKTGALLRRLTSFLPGGAGPSAGQTGDPHP